MFIFPEKNVYGEKLEPAFTYNNDKGGEDKVFCLDEITSTKKGIIKYAEERRLAAVKLD